MKSCLICKSSNGFPICQKCSRSPFRLERCRQKLATTGFIHELKSLYRKGLSEIENNNTELFWDRKLNGIQPLSDQDGMTKDRVAAAYDFIPKFEKVRVLDIGSGYGFLEELIANMDNVELFANDISSVAISNLKRRFKGDFQVMSIYNLKYRNDFFDLVFLLEVLEHIPPSKTFFILRRLKHLIKPKGMIVISVPTNENLEYSKNESGHVREYTVSLIRKELEISGFKIKKIKTFTAFKNFYILKKILSKFLKDRWSVNNIVIAAMKP